MRISDWSSDVCSSDLRRVGQAAAGALDRHRERDIAIERDARFNAQSAAFQIAEIHIADAAHRAMLADGTADRDVERSDVLNFFRIRRHGDSRRGERKEHESHLNPPKTKTVSGPALRMTFGHPPMPRGVATRLAPLPLRKTYYRG